MSYAQMIARAWLDDKYHAELTAKGIAVPARPDTFVDEELDTLANASRDRSYAIAATSGSCDAG